MKNVVILILFFIVSIKGTAQCVNSATPSCDVYRSCFAENCDCKNDKDEYFISYGEKYCKVFLELPGLSKKGIEWRDSTLRCLQEKIVPKLPITEDNKNCDCTSMKSFAFETHVTCYTQPGNSICDLNIEDWIKIGNAIEISDYITVESKDQIIDILKVCLPIAQNKVKNEIDKLLKSLK